VSATIDIAVLGAGDLFGQALLEALADGAIPLGRVYPLALGDAAGEPVPFGNRELPALNAADFDFDQVTLAFICEAGEGSAELARAAAARGCIVVDAAGLFVSADDVPLLAPERNGERAMDLPESGILRMPTASALIAAQVLRPLHERAGLRRVSLVSLEAVSDRGRAGVEELGRQTADLLNFRELKSAVFPQQIAFNVLPQAASAEGHERRIAVELATLLALPELAVTVTVLQVPVFYGHGLSLHVSTAAAFDAAQVAMAFADRPALRLQPGDAGGPSAVVDASGQEWVAVGRIRTTVSEQNSLALWAVADNLKCLARLAADFAQRFALGGEGSA
jgi:aspartate-semialdehyde dehydrogenase